MPDSNTNLYECMYIVEPTVDADQLEAVIQHIEDSVRAAGGEVKEHYDWGRRTFAFRIRKWTEGLYRLLYFQAPGTILDEIRQNALTDDRIIRLMVVVANPRAIYRPRAAAPEVAEEEETQAAEPAAEAPEFAPEDEAAQDAPESDDGDDYDDEDDDTDHADDEE